MEVHRCLGAFIKRAITLSRNILDPRKRYGRRTETSQRLQYQATPYADNLSEHALFTKFGRNDFKEIDKNELVQSVRYLLKYIEKSGEKLVYGGDLPTYFKADIMDEDIACSIGVDDRKKVAI